MPNWNELLNRVRASGGTHDIIRREYLRSLHEKTGRNVIVYYSGWLQKRDLSRTDSAVFSLSDEDKTGFMSAIHKLDRSKGLDLILHTPGGGAAATESLVEYLRAMFGANTRAIVPQLAMSAGTMIACSCREILMGEHSALGPIDPQLYGIPAHGIIEEFNRAAGEIQKDPSRMAVWQPIIAKYNPTLIGECEKAIKWSNDIAKTWLATGMFAGEPDADAKATRIVQELGSHSLTLSHERHISMSRARDLGLKVVALEDDEELQDAVLSVHHMCIQTLEATPAVKIIENHLGTAWVKTGRLQLIGAQVTQDS